MQPTGRPARQNGHWQPVNNDGKLVHWTVRNQTLYGHALNLQRRESVAQLPR